MGQHSPGWGVHQVPATAAINTNTREYLKDFVAHTSDACMLG
jgi:hypothetical protein